MCSRRSNSCMCSSRKQRRSLGKAPLLPRSLPRFADLQHYLFSTESTKFMAMSLTLNRETVAPYLVLPPFCCIWEVQNECMLLQRKRNWAVFVRRAESCRLARNFWLELFYCNGLTGFFQRSSVLQSEEEPQ